MSTRDFLLPDLGEGLTEGEVVSWLVAVGDVVEVDQYVAEIETAKAVVEVPSPFAGTVATLHAEPGEEVEVGQPLITIDIGGGDDGDHAATAEDEGSGEDAAPSSADLAEEHGQPAGVPEGDLSSVDAPGTAMSAEETGGDGEDADDSESGSVLVGYGTSGGGGSRRRRVTAGSGRDPAVRQAPQKIEREGRPKAKPPVRKKAKDLGVDLEYVAGSGEGGIITRADVEAAAEGPPTAAAGVAAQPKAEQPAPQGEQPAEQAEQPAPQPEADRAVTATATQAAASSSDARAERTDVATAGETRIPLGQMRKTIAAQMGRSRREIPEAVTWVEADATPLWKLRRKLNESSDVTISPLALIMRMAVAALRRYPSLNASLDSDTDEIVQYGHVNLGIAAQTPRGLVVPVIPNAHTMSTVELAEALNAKAETARAGKLTPAEMSGGTFTISNYGAFGVDGGDMVINHPEVAILGVGRITDKPWVVDGTIKVRKVITYSIAFDHRVCDGGEGAGFIRLLADMTEDTTTLVATL